MASDADRRLGERAHRVPGDASEISNRIELGRFLEARPDAATPQLVRALKERVEELHRTDAKAARELAQCVVLVAERAGDLESQALAYRARGLAALASGWQRDVLAHYQAAERLYQQLGDELERARVLRSMIDPLMHLGRYDEALAAGYTARDVLKARGEVVLAAQVEANVGNVYHRLDRNAESLDAYDRALAAFVEVGDARATAIVQFNRAHVFLSLNDLSEAERGYREAQRHFRDNALHLHEAQCLYSLAYLAFLRGRYSESLRLFERVRSIDDELGDARHAALCTLDQAELLLSLNAWDEAVGLARSARQAFGDLGMIQERARATLHLGLAALHRRQFEESHACLDDAMQCFEAEGNQVQVALVDLYRAELALLEREPRSALAKTRQAADLFGGQGLVAKEAYARVLAARALHHLGRNRFARRQAEHACAILERSPSPGIGYRARWLLADLVPEPDLKRDHLETAIRQVEQLRSYIVPDELHAAFQTDKISLYEDLAELLLDSSTSPVLGAVFSIVESAKARVLGDQLWRFEIDDVIPPVLDTRGDRDVWRQRLDELNHCYRRLNEAEKGDAPRTRAVPIRREIERREAELGSHYRSIELERSERLGDPSPGGGDLLRPLQQLLGKSEVAIEYFFLDGMLNAFVVWSEGIDLVRDIASREQIRAAIDRWMFQAHKTVLGADYRRVHREALMHSARHALGELWRLVWDPLRVALPDNANEFVIIPAGHLFYVPFHALWDGEQFQVERHAISIAPSARAFIAAHRVRRSPSGQALVLGCERPGLPAIRRELEAVRKRLAGARVLDAGDADRTALKRFGPEAGIIHIASHAEFRSDNPLLSSIELADGRLTFRGSRRRRVVRPDARFSIRWSGRTRYQSVAG
jgi:tetratricopeptide (TPR) repeat protein